MLGFKRFRSAAVTLSGIELMHHIRKRQFDLTSVPLKDTTSPSIWMAVISYRLGFRSVWKFLDLLPSLHHNPYLHRNLSA